MDATRIADEGAPPSPPPPMMQVGVRQVSHAHRRLHELSRHAPVRRPPRGPAGRSAGVEPHPEGHRHVERANVHDHADQGARSERPRAAPVHAVAHDPQRWTTSSSKRSTTTSSRSRRATPARASPARSAPPRGARSARGTASSSRSRARARRRTRRCSARRRARRRCRSSGSRARRGRSSTPIRIRLPTPTRSSTWNGSSLRIFFSRYAGMKLASASSRE